MTQRLAARQVTIHECLVDYRNFQRGRGIRVREIASQQDRRAHHVEEIRANRVPAHQAIDDFFVRLHAVHKRNRVFAPACAGADLHKRRRFDAGKDAQAVHEPLVEANYFGVVVQTLWRSNAKDKQSLSAEPEIGVFEVQEGANGKPCANKKCKAQSHLHGYHDLAGAESSSILACACTGSPQCHPRRHPAHAAERREPENQCCHEGNGQREEQYRAVRSKVDIESRPTRQSLTGPNCQQPAGRAASRHKQQTLGQQLAEQPHATCTERRTQAEFALAGGIARDQEHRYIAAGNHQDETHRDHEGTQWRIDTLPKARDPAGGSEINPWRLLVRTPPGCSQVSHPFVDWLQLRKGLLLAHARGQAADHHEEPPVRGAVKSGFVLGRRAPGLELRHGLKRNPEVGRASSFHAEKVMRGNSDDGEGDALDIQRLTERGWIPSKTPSPAVVAEDRNLCVL